MELDYAYAGECRGHKSGCDVRTVIGLPNNTFASGARDGQIKIWKRTDGGAITYMDIITLFGHRNVNEMGVSALQFIAPGVLDGSLASGALVSAAYDNKVMLWGEDAWEKATTSDPVIVLVGHAKEVIALGTNNQGLLVTGSADNTAKLWDIKTQSCVQTFVGHQYPVWGVALLDSGDVVTVSGDQTIKIWDSTTGQIKKDIKDHQEAIRDVASVPGIGFITCSNDNTVRLYTTDGTLIDVMQGHSNFVFNVRVLQNGLFSSAADDGCVKIWKDSSCTQSLFHPTGLWALAELPNGDIVSAGQDAILRVWTASEDRKALEEVIENYNQDCFAFAQASAAPKIQKKTLNGLEYDFVFDIDLAEGMPPVKLGYNLSDSPFEIAEQFCIQNKLHLNYKETVAKFILQQTESARQQQEQQQIPEGVTPSGVTGGWRAKYFYDTDEKPMEVEQGFKSDFFPQTAPVSFKTGINFKGLEKKLHEINQEISDSHPVLQLSPDELYIFGIALGK